MMPPGITPEQGDIVLIEVPFSDLATAKRRPVIVISNDRHNRAQSDMLVVSLSTQTSSGNPYSFEITQADLASGTLNQPTRVRVDKVYTLLQRRVLRIFGKVNDATLDRIRQLLADLVGP
jgi:mRNA interferase MazF